MSPSPTETSPAGLDPTPAAEFVGRRIRSKEESKTLAHDGDGGMPAQS
jgi:hypothetical protein